MLSRIRDTHCRRGSALQGTTWNKPCKDSAGAAAGRASGRLRRDCPLSFLPRETGPDGSTPSLHCRGEPSAPRLAATSGGSQLQPLLRRLQSEVHRSLSLGPVRGSSRAGAAAPSGRRGALPLSRAPSVPLPRPAGAPGGASALRGRGRPPCAGPVASQAPVAACWEEAGAQRGRMELATGSQVRIWPPAAAPDAPSARLPFALGPAPRFGLETWPSAAALWIGRAQSRRRRSGYAPQVCAVFTVVPPGAERLGAAARGRSPLARVGPRGSPLGRCGREPRERMNSRTVQVGRPQWRSDCVCGARGTGGGGSFFGARPPLFPALAGR